MSDNLKRVAVMAFAVFATLAAIFMLWQLRNIVLLFVVSVVVAAMVREPVEFLTRRRVPQGLAMALIFLIGIAVAAVAIVLLVPAFLREVPALVNELVAAFVNLRIQLAAAGRAGQMLLAYLPEPNQVGIVLNADGAPVPMDAALGMTLSAVDAFTQCIVVIVLALYWTADRVTFERLWLSLLPPELRTRAREVLRTSGDAIGAYLRSEVAQTLLAGVLLYTAFSLLGLHYAATLAAIAALCWLIPMLGGLIALIPVVAIGLLTSVPMTLVAVAITLAVFALMEFVVERRLYRQRRYGSLFAVLVALALLDVFGLLGLLIAPMVANVVQIVWAQWMQPPAKVAVQEAAKPALDLDGLQTRLAAARLQLAAIEDPSPRTAGLMQRLDDLLVKVKEA
jgi:predicted PurR-regulated permease PerM